MDQSTFAQHYLVCLCVLVRLHSKHSLLLLHLQFAYPGKWVKNGVLIGTVIIGTVEVIIGTVDVIIGTVEVIRERGHDCVTHGDMSLSIIICADKCSLY